MVSQISFNPATPLVMHIDLNSCFASVEQQANPLLRHKPLVVVHTDAPYGCILAPSVEAKLWGLKTGMTLAEGKARCPILITRIADPPKYREVHHRFATLLKDYSNNPLAKSIDEFVLTLPSGSDPKVITTEIKKRVKSEIGDYLRVSIGVSTNQNLAKLASGLHKPDGFDVIDQTNYLDIYKNIELQDFCGINIRNEARLHRVGVFTPLQFYYASRQTLRSAFESVLGDYWHARLRGYEVDDVAFQTRSFGQSYVLPHPMTRDEWYPILAKLVSKAGRRMRSGSFRASGVHISLHFLDHSHYKVGQTTKNTLITDQSLIATCKNLTLAIPNKKVKKIAITLFGITKEDYQESLFIDRIKEKRLVLAIDELNTRYGDYTISCASLMGSAGHVRDAIAFGKFFKE
ncbi:MAG: DNA polymerase IV [Candidatus Microgenomates bacterium]